MGKKSNTPRVSVVIPFFNPDLFLEVAIQSVLNQTFEDWELILVNDGSTDSSSDIAHYYAKSYPGKIFCAMHPDSLNHGMAASRNLGASIARGEYIAHLDADDMYLPDKLERQVSILDGDTEIALVFGKMTIWNSWAGGIDLIQNFTVNMNRKYRPRSFIKALLSGSNDPAGYLVRKSIFLQLGGYPEDFWMCEDWAFYVKVNLRYSIYVYSCPDYFYRQHPAQSCSVARQKVSFYGNFAPFLAWLASYIWPSHAKYPLLCVAVFFAICRYSVLAAIEKTFFLPLVLRFFRLLPF